MIAEPWRDLRYRLRALARRAVFGGGGVDAVSVGVSSSYRSPRP